MTLRAVLAATLAAFAATAAPAAADADAVSPAVSMLQLEASARSLIGPVSKVATAYGDDVLEMFGRKTAAKVTKKGALALTDDVAAKLAKKYAGATETLDAALKRLGGASGDMDAGWHALLNELRSGSGKLSKDARKAVHSLLEQHKVYVDASRYDKIPRGVVDPHTGTSGGYRAQAYREISNWANGVAKRKKVARNAGSDVLEPVADTAKKVAGRPSKLKVRAALAEMDQSTSGISRGTIEATDQTIRHLRSVLKDGLGKDAAARVSQEEVDLLFAFAKRALDRSARRMPTDAREVLELLDGVKAIRVNERATRYGNKWLKNQVDDTIAAYDHFIAEIGTNRRAMTKAIDEISRRSAGENAYRALAGYGDMHVVPAATKALDDTADDLAKLLDRYERVDKYDLTDVDLAKLDEMMLKRVRDRLKNKAQLEDEVRHIEEARLTMTRDAETFDPIRQIRRAFFEDSAVHAKRDALRERISNVLTTRQRKLESELRAMQMDEATGRLPDEASAKWKELEETIVSLRKNTDARLADLRKAKKLMDRAGEAVTEAMEKFNLQRTHLQRLVSADSGLSKAARQECADALDSAKEGLLSAHALEQAAASTRLEARDAAEMLSESAAAIDKLRVDMGAMVQRHTVI